MSQRIINKLQEWIEQNQKDIEYRTGRIMINAEEIARLKIEIDQLENNMKENKAAIEKLR